MQLPCGPQEGRRARKQRWWLLWGVCSREIFQVTNQNLRALSIRCKDVLHIASGIGRPQHPVLKKHLRASICTRASLHSRRCPRPWGPARQIWSMRQLRPYTKVLDRHQRPRVLLGYQRAWERAGATVFCHPDPTPCRPRRGAPCWPRYRALITGTDFARRGNR